MITPLSAAPTEAHKKTSNGVTRVMMSKGMHLRKARLRASLDEAAPGGQEFRD